MNKKNKDKKGIKVKSRKKNFSFFEKNLERKIINWSVVKKEERALLLITGLIFCLTFIIFWETRKPQAVMLIINPDAVANNQFLPKERGLEAPLANKNLNWQSFGDNFSSFAYLNTDQTDMYLDLSL